MRQKLPCSLFVCLGVFVLDRTCKMLATQFPFFSWHTAYNLIGWEYFENTGVAFGLPITGYAQIATTVILTAALCWYAYIKRLIHDAQKNTALLFLITGAMSNLVDRVAYGYTIDYIRFFTSIINFADISIVYGILYLIRTKKC